MKQREIYSRLHFFVTSVIGLSENHLQNHLPEKIKEKFIGDIPLTVNDYEYLKEKYDINIGYLLTGQTPFLRKNYKKMNTELLSKRQMEQLTFLLKEQTN